MRTRQTFWFRNRTRSTAPSISSFGSRGPMAAEPASSSAPTLLGCQALEQFLLLAKTARGASVHELIRQATAAPGVYVFGELLETDCVRELEGGNSAEFVRLLELFAFGTYSDYKKLTASLPALSPAQIRKLKHLTIVSLAAKSKTIPYSTLLLELDIRDLRELEDLVIEAIYAGVIEAKLDQRNEKLEVECFIGRDMKMEELGSMVDQLENWSASCAAVLLAMEEQVGVANEARAESLRLREQAELEARQLKQSLKTAASDVEEPHPSKEVSPGTAKPQPKKGIRGSAAHSRMFGKK